MSLIELKYKQKVAFWYERLEALTNITDRLQSELERQKKIVEKVVSENTQLVIELKQLQEEQRVMSFSNITLEKQ